MDYSYTVVLISRWAERSTATGSEQSTARWGQQIEHSDGNCLIEQKTNWTPLSKNKSSWSQHCFLFNFIKPTIKILNQMIRSPSWFENSRQTSWIKSLDYRRKRTPGDSKFVMIWRLQSNQLNNISWIKLPYKQEIRIDSKFQLIWEPSVEPVD